MSSVDGIESQGELVKEATADPMVIQRHGIAATMFLIIGSGIMNQPQVWMMSGVIGTPFLYVICFSAVWLGSVMVVKSADNLKLVGKNLDYAVLAHTTHGPMGSFAVDGSIAVYNATACLSYVLLIGSMTSELVQGWSGSDSFVTQSYFTTPIMALLFVFPLGLLPHYTHTQKLSILGVAAIVVVVAVVLFYGPVCSEGKQVRAETVGAINYWSTVGMVQKAGSVIFAFSYPHAIVHAYIGLTPRTTKAWKIVVTGAMSAGAFMCLCMGLAGYLSFREEVDGNILTNFVGWVGDALKILLVAHLVWYTPQEFVVLRHSILRLAKQEPLAMSTALRVGSTFAIIGCLVAICIALDATGVSSGTAFGIILDIGGGVAGSFAAFILPAIIFLRYGVRGSACTRIIV
ncbi:transmembrane amino acid transporter protein-domain-containing protein [Tribonema minus]|uniref:Transmembrane amino acid transporter protein-domain-containing protein n=1 Tax=Tribonema minus TaxID=303371 RepID=A0A835Z9L5_9STRA|nr:transmembrane amino acid transporter protein-domain-containing protein [Tribonema minus]